MTAERTIDENGPETETGSYVDLIPCDGRAKNRPKRSRKRSRKLRYCYANYGPLPEVGLASEPSLTQTGERPEVGAITVSQGTTAKAKTKWQSQKRKDKSKGETATAKAKRQRTNKSTAVSDTIIGKNKVHLDGHGC